MSKPKASKDRFSPSTIQRFLNQLKVGENGCVEWDGVKDKDGYGRFQVGGREGKKERVHRWAFELSKQEKLTSDQKVCHSCDNTSCVLPTHLFSGSQQDNMQDASRKGRMCQITHNNKLDVNRARKIKNSSESKEVLAAQYGVSEAAIRDIWAERTWKNA